MALQFPTPMLPTRVAPRQVTIRLAIVVVCCMVRRERLSPPPLKDVAMGLPCAARLVEKSQGRVARVCAATRINSCCTSFLLRCTATGSFPQPYTVGLRALCPAITVNGYADVALRLLHVLFAACEPQPPQGCQPQGPNCQLEPPRWRLRNIGLLAPALGHFAMRFPGAGPPPPRPHGAGTSIGCALPPPPSSA